MSQKVIKPQKDDIRELIFGSPGPNFEGETQLQVARVWTYYEKHPPADGDVLKKVAEQYQDHWRKKLGKEVQDLKAVKEKVNSIVKKIKSSVDSNTYILKDPPKYLPKQKAKFERIVNIDLNQKKSKASKVILHGSGGS